MLEAEFRPLAPGEWPGHSPLTRDGHRIEAPFRSTATATFDLLERELRMLSAKNVVVQTAHRRDQIRNDGWPKSNAADPEHPGVALSFETAHGPLIYATDIYAFAPWGYTGKIPGHDSDQKRTRVDRMAGWLCNLRAIALGLEALRKVDRYGITASGEQYKGWSALPAGMAMGAPLTVNEAATILADLAGDYDAGDLLYDVHTPDPESVRAAYRIASKLHHPDVGGDPALFAQVQRTYERLTQGE